MSKICTVFALIFNLPPLVLLGVVAGVAKEVWDKVTGRGHVEFKDCVATWVGSAPVLMLYIIYYVSFTK